MSTSFHASRLAKAQHSAASATKQGLALLIVAGVLWGTGGPAGSLLQALTHIHPLSTASYRLLVGGSLACLVLLAAGRLRHLPRSGAALRRILLAGLLLAFFQTSYFVAVDLIAVSLATLLTIGSIPVFVTVTTCLLERARPRPRLAAAVALSVVGLALLAGFPSVTASRADIAAGVSCALLAGAGFTTLTMVNRRSVPGLGPLAVTALGCLVGGAVLVPLGLAVGMAFTPNPAAVGVLVYLGAVPTALAYLAYFWGSRSAPATAVALAALLEPLTATLLSVALFGESLTAVGTLGALLLAAALVLDYWRPAGGRAW